MHGFDFIYLIFMIFAGAAAVATIALFARQTLIVAYVLLGALVGPAGFGLVANTEIVNQAAEIGVIFLLYLLGLNLYPQKLMQMLREATVVTLTSSVVFAALGVALLIAFGLPWQEALIAGGAMMFSSTIIGLKLLPTTALHHRHAGEIIISVLLIQDIVAILLLVMIKAFGQDGSLSLELLKVLTGLPALALLAWAGQRYLLQPLLLRFDRISEYVFLLAIGWCVGLAQLANTIGLSYEVGAFIAGVALAASPIARFIADSLRPLRDFFLVIFFFSLGVTLDLDALGRVWWQALLLAGVMLALKPLVFRWLLMREGEPAALATEIGVRLGQTSEFALLISVVALRTGAISVDTSYLIQATTLVGFVVSSYFIVARFPTPIALSDELRRD